MGETKATLSWIDDVQREMDTEREARERAMSAVRSLLVENPGPWALQELREKVLCSEQQIGEIAVHRALLHMLAGREMQYISSGDRPRLPSEPRRGTLVMAVTDAIGGGSD